jgi:hypothetical protein
MLLSALYEQIQSAPQEVLEGGVYLATPDTVPGDDIDVFVVGIRDVDVDHDRHEIKLIPAGLDHPNGGAPFLLLRILLEQMPASTLIWGDFEILVELPLDRGSGEQVATSLASVAAFHIGRESEESWFLVRPAAEYGNNVLPV